MCLFCDIVAGKIPSSKVYENDYVLCFKDINPVAPVHVLVVPKKHFDNINELTASGNGLVTSCFNYARRYLRGKFFFAVYF